MKNNHCPIIKYETILIAPPTSAFLHHSMDRFFHVSVANLFILNLSLDISFKSWIPGQVNHPKSRKNTVKISCHPLQKFRIPIPAYKIETDLPHALYVHGLNIVW